MKIFFLLILILWTLALSACGPRPDETTPEMAQSLLKVRGYNFTEEDFFKSLKQNDAAVVKLFLQAGMDPNVKNKTGQTALTFAAVNSNVPTLKNLIEKADLNLRDGLGNSPLYAALKEKKYENFEFLLDNGASPDSVGKSGNTDNQSVLYIAVLLNETKFVKKLLEKGANPDLADSDGALPISEVIIYSRPNMEIFKMLLEKTKDVNQSEQDGTTLLMHAANNTQMPRENLQEIIKALLERGANKNLKNQKGKTALAIAQEKQNKEAIELLK